MDSEGHAQAGQGSMAARRADAGAVRLSGRDAAGLVRCAGVYGATHDLLAAYPSAGRTADCARSSLGGGTPGTPPPGDWGKSQAPRLIIDWTADL